MMNINYGLFFSFQYISDKNGEDYDLKKHQSQNIWKGNRYRLIVGENKPRILTFSRRRQNRLNGVLGETRTARTRVWASCAHASLCKFTSGSRRSLSRPRILRSLSLGVTREQLNCALSRVFARHPKWGACLQATNSLQHRFSLQELLTVCFY